MERDEDPVTRFVRHCYNLVDDNQAEELQQLYRENSVLTFEGKEFHGPNGILAKLASPNFQGRCHYIGTIDIQPFSENGALVVVAGRLKVAGKKKRNFRQTFRLMPAPQGSFYVLNDMFWSN